MPHRRTAVGIPGLVAAIAVTAVVVAAAIFAAAPFSTTVTKTVPEISTSVNTTTSTQTTTVTVTSKTSSSPITSSISSSSCSGYPPGGNCPGTFSYTFTLSVNYTGTWKLAYEGCSGLGTCSPPYTTTGSANGTGYYTKSITLTGPNNSGLTLCGQAQKLDASDATLILTVTGYNETSLPYGSVSYCGGVVP